MPEITDEVRVETAIRYIQAYEQITGEKFSPDLSPDPIARIEANLKAL
jgi:hypothetical protein